MLKYFRLFILQQGTLGLFRLPLEHVAREIKRGLSPKVGKCCFQIAKTTSLPNVGQMLADFCESSPKFNNLLTFWYVHIRYFWDFLTKTDSDDSYLRFSMCLFSKILHLLIFQYYGFLRILIQRPEGERLPRDPHLGLPGRRRPGAQERHVRPLLRRPLLPGTGSKLAKLVKKIEKKICKMWMSNKKRGIASDLIEILNSFI